jgi:hypothetical protein
MDIADLPPEEADLLELLIEEKLARERVPVPERAVVSRFEKYAFPIGIDDAGARFPLPWRGSEEEA